MTTRANSISQADRIHFGGQYNNIIQNIKQQVVRLRTSNNPNEHTYVLYISPTGEIQSSLILYKIIIHNITYYCTFKNSFDDKYNIPFESIIVYDLLFGETDLVDITTNPISIDNRIHLHNSINSQRMETTRGFLWDGSHFNISPDFKNLLINYHYTFYRHEQLTDRGTTENRLIAYKNRNFCRFSMPEWQRDQQLVKCVGEPPDPYGRPKIFDNIQGRNLSSLDMQIILNIGFGLPIPVIGGANIIKFKVTKPRKSIKRDNTLKEYEKAASNFVKSLAKENNIILHTTSVVICTPERQYAPGLVILNTGMNELKDNSKTKKIAGYLNKQIHTRDISKFLN